MRHFHHIKQTSFATIILLVVGTALYFGFSANLKGMAATSSPIKEQKVVKKTTNPLLPEIKERDSSEAGESKEEGLPESESDYLLQLPGLPAYFVTSVIDGGTLILDSGQRLRLIGIKAPDKDEEMGLEATDFLKGMIEGKQIYLQIDSLNPKDDFGRIRGVAYIENTNVNIEMLKAGLAHVYPTTPSIVGANDWASFEKEAMEAKRGLWGGKTYYNKFIKEVPQI